MNRDREELLDALKEAYAHSDGNLTVGKYRAYYRANTDLPSYDRIQRTFGTFLKACEAAKVPSRNQKLNLATDRGKIRIQIQRNHFGRQNGLSMSKYDHVRSEGDYCSTTLQRVYGSWSAALKDADIQPREK